MSNHENIRPNNNIVVIGNGYLGQAYMRALHYLGHSPFMFSREWIDYSDPQVLGLALRCIQGGIGYIINAAGFTGHTIDECEKRKQECYDANVKLPRILAEVAKSRRATLIHISSGCLFTGAGPFSEEDKPNNLTPWYTQCKFFAEEEIRLSEARHFIFRIRMPFSWSQSMRNWLNKLSFYQKILDGQNSVTFLDEFCMRSWQVAEKAKPGIYHAAYPTPVSTLAVAKMLFDAKLKRVPPEPYDPKEFIRWHVPRSSAVLDCSKFEQAYGSKFGDPECALRWCIDKMREEGATCPS